MCQCAGDRTEANAFIGLRTVKAIARDQRSLEKFRSASVRRECAIWRGAETSKGGRIGSHSLGCGVHEGNDWNGREASQDRGKQGKASAQFFERIRRRGGKSGGESGTSRGLQGTEILRIPVGY